jgi:hypothetical protein
MEPLRFVHPERNSGQGSAATTGPEKGLVLASLGWLRSVPRATPFGRQTTRRLLGATHAPRNCETNPPVKYRYMKTLEDWGLGRGVQRGTAAGLNRRERILGEGHCRETCGRFMCVVGRPWRQPGRLPYNAKETATILRLRSGQAPRGPPLAKAGIDVMKGFLYIWGVEVGHL